MELPPNQSNNIVEKRLAYLRNKFKQYRQVKLKNNKAIASLDLQNTLFKAAKVGNINLMMELISYGANPFSLDEHNRDAITYAMEVDPIKTGNMLLELISKAMQSDNV